MKRKIKVLYVHHSGLLGGAPKSLTYLVSKIDKNKYEPTILTIRKGPAIDLLKSSGAKVVVRNFMFPFHGSTVSGMTLKLFLRNIIGAWPTYFAAKKFIKKNNPEIIHLNSTCLFMVAKAAKKVSKDIKVICHVREPLLNSYAGNILKKYNHKYVDGYVAIDQFDSKTVNSEGKLMEVVYNFVDFNTYNSNVSSQEIREELKIPEGGVSFLYLGRIVEGNGVLELVNAFKKALDKNKNIYLIVGGFYFNNNNVYEQKVIEFCKNIDNIILLKFRQDVPQLISCADALVSPFNEPHFARSIIEGAAMGKLSIGTNIGGPNELIIHNETGFLYQKGNENELIHYILKVANDNNLREQLGLNALKFARKNFDSNKNAKRTFEFYERINN